MNEEFEFDLGGEPSYETINACFPAPKYRVSQSVYDGKQSDLGGVARPGLCFVICGRCKIVFKQETFDLKAGDVVKLPNGTYRLEKPDDCVVELVAVWNLEHLIKAQVQKTNRLPENE